MSKRKKAPKQTAAELMVEVGEDTKRFDERLRKAADAMSKAGEALMAGLEKELDEEPVKIDRTRGLRLFNTHPYSHRNGESNVPTVEGWYWFNPELHPEHRGVIRIFIEDGEPMVNVTFIKEGYSRHMPAKLKGGQWWGPILPPWEQDV